MMNKIMPSYIFHKRFFAWICIIFINLIIVTLNAFADTWLIQTVDSNGYVGDSTSLALDKANNVHIGYHAKGELYYATNKTGPWVLEAAGGDGAAGLFTSVKLDPAGNAHISYYNYRYGNNELLYATNSSGKWKTITIDSGNNVGYCSSLAVDTKNKIHISYIDGTNFYLNYATNATKTGEWQITTIDNSGTINNTTAIAVDKDGKVHISYYDAYNFSLKYATNATDTGDWQSTTVDENGYTGAYNSLAIDSKGNIHIGYHDSYNSDLKYARKDKDKTEWKIETADSIGNVGDYTSLALDGEDNPHMSYYECTSYQCTTGNLKYARKDKDTGEWKIETVDNGGNVGLYTSIAVDNKGDAHISYFDSANGNLRYATNEICLPTSITVSPKKLIIPATKTRMVLIRVKGKDNCPIVGEEVKVALSKTGKKVVSVWPQKDAITDYQGRSWFTFSGKKKGKIRVTFTMDNLKKKITVQVN